MKPLFWIVGVPLLLCGAFFAIANRQDVAIDLWPFAERMEIPLFVALIGALYLGFSAGAFVAWWAGRHGRRTARETRRRVAELETELQRRRAAEARPEAAATQSALLPATVRP